MKYSFLIKKLRNKLLISQVELAEMLNVSFSTVSRWENDHHEPTLKQKRQLRDLFTKHGIEVE